MPSDWAAAKHLEGFSTASTVEFDAAFYAVQAVELVGVVQLVIASDFAVA
jgi:hypothetical protein